MLPHLDLLNLYQGLTTDIIISVSEIMKLIFGQHTDIVPFTIRMFETLYVW